jgi:hypothetical protein
VTISLFRLDTTTNLRIERHIAEMPPPGSPLAGVPPLPVTLRLTQGIMTPPPPPKMTQGVMTPLTPPSSPFNSILERVVRAFA